MVLLWCYCGATVLGGFRPTANLTLSQVGRAAVNGLRGPHDPGDLMAAMVSIKRMAPMAHAGCMVSMKSPMACVVHMIPAIPMA